MPTYEYQCNNCNNVVDVFHRMIDTPEVVCTNTDCKADTHVMKRIISAVTGVGNAYDSNYHRAKPKLVDGNGVEVSKEEHERLRKLYSIDGIDANTFS